MSKSKKQKTINKLQNILVVIIVIILFISTAIIAIIYTQGGKITREGIIETGSIRLEIQPDSGDHLVYLDERQIKSDERLINNIKPGLHYLKIESSKFHSWEKEILVSKSYVTSVQVKLFPLEPELKQITQTNIKDLFFSEDGSFAYYIVNDPLLEVSENGLWRIRLEDQDLFFKRESEPEKLAEINDPVIVYLSNPNTEIITDNNNNQLLINDIDTKSLVIFDPSENTTERRITNIGQQLGFYPERVSWFNNNNSIIVSNDEIVMEFNLVNIEKTLITYTPDSRPIYDTNGLLLYSYSPSTLSINVYQNKINRKVVEVNSANLTIPTDLIISDDSTAFLVGNGTEYYYYNLETTKSTLAFRQPDVAIVDVSYNATNIITMNNNELFAHNIEKQLANENLLTKTTKLNFAPDTLPRFINNSGLILFNDISSKMIKVSENDGTNLTTLLDNTEVENGYFKFQKDGSSLTIMVEDENQDNILNKNLFKLVLNTSSLPFNL